MYGGLIHSRDLIYLVVCFLTVKVALQVIRANLGFLTDLGKNSDGGIEKKES
jgi:hypothetical protein